MSINAEKNIANFQITENTIANNESLQQAIINSINKQQLFLEKDAAKIKLPANKNCKCRTVVSRKRSFEASSFYAVINKKICVLNFASSTNPGGGVRQGSSAQEEALCRCSTLYPSLCNEYLANNFYRPHRHPKKDNCNLNFDDCIYTPEVIVFKNDILFPELLPENEWYKVDVLTCSAPNLRDVLNKNINLSSIEISEDELYVVLYKRIEQIFKVAISNDVDVLILGAFGCGVFGNPPKVVAKAFYDVQEKYESYFDTIEYAIYCSPKYQDNYVAFSEQFKIKANFE